MVTKKKKTWRVELQTYKSCYTTGLPWVTLVPGLMINLVIRTTHRKFSGMFITETCYASSDNELIRKSIKKNLMLNIITFTAWPLGWPTLFFFSLPNKHIWNSYSIFISERYTCK